VSYFAYLLTELNEAAVEKLQFIFFRADGVVHQTFVAVALDQMLVENSRGHLSPLFKNQKRFNKVAQFADIAWPWVAQKHFRGIGGESFKGNSVFLLELMDEMLREQQNVAAAFPEGGNL